jgi:HEAT repeat protein
MVRVRQLQEVAVKRHQLDPAELAEIKVLVNDPDQFVRARALTALFSLGGGGQSKTAAAIARGKLTDQKGLVRQYALSALARLKAPDAASTAKKMLRDPDPHVRERAAQIARSR